jgi:putative phosphoribosyl transferase
MAAAVAGWLSQEPKTHDLHLGYFGASTGAGAVLVAAARDPATIKTVVSRGGCPDLAQGYLSAIQAPTLLIIGGNGEGVIELNKKALRLLRCPKKRVIVPDATHLF